MNDGTKARFWDRIDGVFPEGFRELGQDLARLSSRDFPEDLARSVADFDPQVGAVNYYTGRGRMGWHADDYNFAKRDRPICHEGNGSWRKRVLDPRAFPRTRCSSRAVF